jgi:hypothetical protein
MWSCTARCIGMSIALAGLAACGLALRITFCSLAVAARSVPPVSYPGVPPLGQQIDRGKCRPALVPIRYRFRGDRAQL